MCRIIPIGDRIELHLKEAPNQEPYRLLYLDDEMEYPRVAREHLSQLINCRVDAADNPVLASELVAGAVASGGYDYWVVDVDLGSKNQSGDLWLLDNAALSPRAKKAIVTAKPDLIKKKTIEQLELIRIPVYRRAEEELLYEDVVSDASAKDKETDEQLVRRLREIVLGNSIIPHDAKFSHAVANSAKKLFSKWLSTRRDQSSKQLWHGERTYSFAEIEKELNEGSEFGMLMLELFQDHMLDLIGLEREEE